MSTNLEIQIKSVKKEIKALDAKVERLLKKVESAGKAAPAKKIVTKKAAKKVAPKKAAVKKAPAKKVGDGVTAYDTVIGIITKSKKGVTNPELMKKTGFDKKKVANILFKAKKRGTIKTEKKGVYVKG